MVIPHEFYSKASVVRVFKVHSKKNYSNHRGKSEINMYSFIYRQTSWLYFSKLYSTDRCKLNRSFPCSEDQSSLVVNFICDKVGRNVNFPFPSIIIKWYFMWALIWCFMLARLPVFLATNIEESSVILAWAFLKFQGFCFSYLPLRVSIVYLISYFIVKLVLS